MGLRGPAPTPTEVLEKRGSWRASIHQGTSPEVVRGVPEPPEWLQGDALECWNWLTEQLHAMGILAKSDMHLVTIYCETWARWMEAEAWMRDASFMAHGKRWRGTVVPVKAKVHVLRPDGTVMKDSFGHPVFKYEIVRFEDSPQARQAEHLHDRLVKLLREMGLTPSSRSRVQRLPHDRPKLVGGATNVGKPLPFLVPRDRPSGP
ncbi:MAG: phage terminase small subunit P27 family [Planctomycetota bacterium]